MYSRFRAVSIPLLLWTIIAVRTSWGGIEPVPEAPSNCPKFADAQQHRDEPKTPAVKEALKRCLADLSKAQEELHTLYAKGEVKRTPTINGSWVSTTKSTTDEFFLTFSTQTSPPGEVTRRVFADGNSDSPKTAYRIEFDDQGRIKRYAAFTGLHVYQSLVFYPNGGINTFRTEVDRQTSGQATWDADGKLQSDGVSPQLPRDEKGLPELEDALRHGDDDKKYKVLQAMTEIGVASIPYALNVLKDGDDLSRERAAFLFGLLSGRAHPASSTAAIRLREDAVPTLARRLREDKSAKVRTSIARSLGMIGQPAEAAIPALEEASTNGVPELATAAKMALEQIHPSLSN